MSALSRAGTTVTELLVALMLTGMVAAGALAIAGRVGEAYRVEAFEIERARTLRIAAAVLPAELRELDAVDGDVIAMGQTAITIRAPRQLAAVCGTPRFAVPPTRVAVTLRDMPRYGLRDLNQRTDSAWLFYEGDSATPDDDGWIEASIDTLAPDTCPDGNRGWKIAGALRPTAGQHLGAGTIPSGAPVLVFETVTYRLYRSTSDRQWYVGLESAGDLQPLLGPVTGDGLAFAYLDSSGAAVTEPSRVALIDVRVRAPTTEPVRRPDRRLGSPLDSLVTVVALRNGPRF
jgi:hypothetical protein